MRFANLELPDPSPSTSFVVLHIEEIGGNCYVEYDAWQGTERVHLDFKRVIGARMDSYHSECGAAPARIGEVIDSQWLARCVESQRLAYPRDPDTLAGIRHFFVKGHDVTVEVLAESVTLRQAPR